MFMHYVYIIESIKYKKRYIGYTKDLVERVSRHNNDRGVRYTEKYAPWKLVFYASFTSQKKAMRFEKYLKSGSGREFLKRWVLDN